MISISKLVFMGMVETILILVVAVALVWWNARRKRPMQVVQGGEDVAGPLRERIQALEAELETAKRNVAEASRKVEETISAQVAPETSEEEGGIKEISIMDVPDASEQPGATGEPELPTVDDKGRSLEDILLIISLQLKVLREQEGVLSSIFKGFEGAGPDQIQEQLALLMEMHFNYDSALGTLEAEFPAVKTLKGVSGSGEGASGGASAEELEAGRKTIAELESSLKKAKEEFRALEHEYDILYSKTAAAETGETGG